MISQIKKAIYQLPESFLPLLVMIILIMQFVLAFFVFYRGQIQWVVVLGWVVWFVGAIFGILPIYTLNKYGKLDPKKGFLETTEMVTEGVYSIVRHPQYLANILLHLTLMLISQNIYVIVLGLFAMILVFLDTLKADQECVVKFGQKYERYTQDVPRLNFVWGIIKKIFKKSSSN